MVLNLIDGWRIRSDDHCWRVEKLKVSTNQETGERYTTWDILSYHGELDQAVNRALDTAFRKIPEMSLTETLAEMQRLNTASVIVAVGAPNWRASIPVHFPVPFWPAASRIRSTMGLPVSSST